MTAKRNEYKKQSKTILADLLKRSQTEHLVDVLDAIFTTC